MRLDLSTKAAEWVRERDRCIMVHMIPPLG